MHAFMAYCNDGFRYQRCRTIDGWIEIELYMHACSSVAVVHGWIDGWLDECMDQPQQAGQNDGGRKLVYGGGQLS